MWFPCLKVYGSVIFGIVISVIREERLGAVTLNDLSVCAHLRFWWLGQDANIRHLKHLEVDQAVSKETAYSYGWSFIFAFF